VSKIELKTENDPNTTEVMQVKITNSEIIKTGERELIDTIIGDLDWGTIEKIIRDRHQLSIQDDIEYKDGDIIVHENKVAYRLDFEVKMSLSVVFDREGTCLSLLAAEGPVPEPETVSIETGGTEEDLKKAMGILSIPESDIEPKPAADEDILELTSEIKDRPENVNAPAENKIADAGAVATNNSDMEKEMADLLDSTLDIESEQALEDDILQLTSELAAMSEDTEHSTAIDATTSTFTLVNKEPANLITPAITSGLNSTAASDVTFADELTEFDAEPDDFQMETMEALTASDLIEDEKVSENMPASTANNLATETKGHSEKEPQEKMSKMASQIADLISEINED
jgi:hypothetical protein